MENHIPKEIKNMLIPEFLMKELSDLEQCTEGCANCRKAQDAGGKLSKVCLILQCSKAEDKVRKTVPQVFDFLNTLRLAQRGCAAERRSTREILYKAFPMLTVPQCNKLFEAWALYTAKYEDPIDKDSLVIRYRYYFEYQVKDKILPAHVVEYWDRDVLEWKRQGIYFFSNTDREIDSGENLEERSRFLTCLLNHIHGGYKVECVPGIFRNVRLEEDD